jgi:hypothetical protein
MIEPAHLLRRPLEPGVQTRRDMRNRITLFRQLARSRNACGSRCAAASGASCSHRRMKLPVIALIAPFLLAAASDPFVGTWKLNADKSTPLKRGPAAARGAHHDVYEDGRRGDGHGGRASAGWETTEDRTPETFDGQPHDRYEGKPNGEILTHRRIDERTEETVWRREGKSMAITTRTASADGRTLTSVVRSAGKAEPDTVMGYERQ